MLDTDSFFSSNKPKFAPLRSWWESETVDFAARLVSETNVLFTCMDTFLCYILLLPQYSQGSEVSFGGHEFNPMHTLQSLIKHLYHKLGRTAWAEICVNCNLSGIKPSAKNAAWITFNFVQNRSIYLYWWLQIEEISNRGDWRSLGNHVSWKNFGCLFW